MRIRTQLILAAFVLAVVPLAAIVTYSYHSSRRALEAASLRETERQTAQMDRRLTMVRTELGRGLAAVSSFPADEVGNVVGFMGNAASLVDAIEFHPIPQVHPAPVPSPNDSAADLPSPPDPSVAPPPAPPDAPTVFEIPPGPEIPHYVMSDAQQGLIGRVSALATKLATPGLSPQEREEMHRQLSQAQDELHAAIAKDVGRFREEGRKARLAWREQAEQARGESPIPPPPGAPVTTSVAPVAAVPIVAQRVLVRRVTPEDAEKAAAAAKKVTLLLGEEFEAPVTSKGELVGRLTARVKPEQVIQRVLGNAVEDSSEIAFAVDQEGALYARNDEDRSQLERLKIAEKLRKGESLKGIDGWIVSTSTDPKSGLRIGVARQVGDNLEGLRRAAARNFSLGLGLIAFALIGIVPLSNHLTREVRSVTEGAERIAHGDLMTRLPVRSKSEFGQLARAFNRMAEDLSLQQEQLLRQERAQKDRELQQRLLAVEYERKSAELEEARRFQLSMLPKQVPQHEAFDVAVFTRTATEVGGDYYDFHLAGDVLSVTIGDATGHGAKAGTMVTVVKTLFSGYDGSTGPSAFLGDAAEKIKRMDLGRMAMALSLARFESNRLTVASAGMPPLLVCRAASGAIEELSLGATPLGTLGTEYAQMETTVASGDTVLFLSDGFPELMSDGAQQLGYSGAMSAFADAAGAATAAAVIESLADTVRRWHGMTPPNDDVTFVVVRIV